MTDQKSKFVLSEILQAKFKELLTPVIAAFEVAVDQKIADHIEEIEHMAQADETWSEDDYNEMIESLLMGVYIMAALEAAQSAKVTPGEFIKAVHTLTRMATITEIKKV